MSEQTIIARTVCKVLEDAAFLFVEGPWPGTELPAGWEPFGCEIGMEGPKSVRLSIWMDPVVARTAAANMLGLEEGHARAGENAREALKELTNMIGGNLLKSLEDSLGPMLLGLPRELEEGKNPPRAQGGALSLDVEGAPVVLRWKVAQ